MSKQKKFSQRAGSVLHKAGRSHSRNWVEGKKALLPSISKRISRWVLAIARRIGDVMFPTWATGARNMAWEIFSMRALFVENAAKPINVPLFIVIIVIII